METKLATQMTQPMIQKAFETLDGMKEFAKVLLDSGICPYYLYEKAANGKDPDFTKGNVAKLVGIFIKGDQLKMHPMTAMQGVVPVNGLMSIKGDEAKALVLSSGKIMSGSWKEEESGTIEREDFKVTITAGRNDTGETLSRSFSIDDAKRAGLWITQKDLQAADGWKKKQSAWYKYSKRMCKYRALGFLVRDLFPDVMSGTYTAEEAADFPIDQTEVIQTTSGAEVILHDKNFTQERSENLTQKASDKIQERNDVRKYPMTPDEAAPAQPIQEGDDALPAPFNWTESKLMDSKAETLEQACREVALTKQAVSIIPGKNTNKKLRNIILAYVSGELLAVLRSHGWEERESQADEGPPPPQEPADTGEKGEVDPIADQRMDTADIEEAKEEPLKSETVIDPDDAMEEVPGEENMEPNTSFDEQGAAEPPADDPERGIDETSNDLDIEVPPLPEGGEREFEDYAPLFQEMKQKGGITNDSFDALNSKLFGSKYADKEGFCKTASVAEINLLLNSR